MENRNHTYQRLPRTIHWLILVVDAERLVGLNSRVSLPKIQVEPANRVEGWFQLNIGYLVVSEVIGVPLFIIHL